MADRIDPMLAQRLDAFTVPALPADFANRLVAAALAESGAEPAPLPPLRRPFARRWLRGGFTGLGAIAVGMISISAAAMGYFGEPIRHAVQAAPVIGTVIERVLPKAKHPAKPAAPTHLAKPAAPPVAVAASAAPEIAVLPAARLTPLERRERRRAIMADPEARRAWIETHPVAAQRIARRRAEMRRRRIEEGFVREVGPEADGQVMLRPPARQRMLMRRERLERLRERRERMRERRWE